MTATFSDSGFPGHQVVQSPTINNLAEIAKDLNIDLNDSELKEYQGVFQRTLQIYIKNCSVRKTL